MRTALVTGGARGLGRALTNELVKRGYRVIVLDVVPPPSEEHVTFIECDLAQFDERCIAGIPVLDVIICNAGITAVGDFKTMSSATDRLVIETNVVGHMNLVKSLLSQDRLAERGHVAFTNSASVYVPWPVGIAYATSKAALDGFALALESYLTGRRVSVTRVFPGAMRTDHGGYAKAKGKQVGADPARLAPKIVNGILRRKRKLFPDPMGRILVAACSLFPKTMSRMIYRKLDLGVGEPE